MRQITIKLKEISASVLPIVLFVLFLHFTITPLEFSALKNFLFGSIFVILGLTIFLVGVDISITPVGEYLGKGLILSAKTWIVLGIGFILGFMISFAEPSLGVLANQISIVTHDAISASSILIAISTGVGLIVGIGSLRISKVFPIKKLIWGFYLLMFAVMIVTSNTFISLSFDASAAVTGAIAVPFIMAIGAGIAELKKGASEADNFGLTGMVPVGAVIAMMLLSLFIGADDVSGSLEISSSHDIPFFSYYLQTMSAQLKDVAISVLPVTFVFYLYQVTKLKLNRFNVHRITAGFIYVFIGLVLYLTGVNAGFMNVGALIGFKLASLDSHWPLLLISFLLGAMTILAEPAVSVQTHMIEEVTGGSVKGKPIKASLSIGAGLAILFAVSRILIPELELWHIVVPGYIIVLLMTLKVSDLFVGMAFDAGSVASGPMAATFILAFVQGIAEAIPSADVLQDGFGMIALVLMVPIIAILIFGYLYEKELNKS
ncbi:DUF1538 domain-containing protein [Allofustis seminis]|uniref:DUF1538 domain-containing protein n=1 Tax=Allofustis seminis TaxID=166939 RepID=UPI00035F63EB|nr:DUF1538 domain-containing protein [Allofustis seminis]